MIGELAQRELAVPVLVDALPGALKVIGTQAREDLTPGDAELLLLGLGLGLGTKQGTAWPLASQGASVV